MKLNFQLILLIIFIVAAVFGILVFSGAIPIGGGSAGSQGTVVLWGTVPSGQMAPIIKDFNSANPTFVVNYVQKSSETFDQDLLEALAGGAGPDMFFLPDNLVYHYANKIITIPYSNYPLSTFKNVFAGAGEVFSTSEGIYAFPMSVDPLVMYYDRSILDANGIVYPPATWDDLVSMTPTLTKKDNSGQITDSAVALGQFSNIVHAKDILATLFMQAGNPIISEKNGVFISALNSLTGKYSLSSLLKFYTSFADPNDALYSWNKSIPNSTDDFSAGHLAFYFGFSSELQSLINKNPNQNFFVAGVPQIKNSTSKLTVARVTGLAISSSSKNFGTAFLAANLMATGDFASKFAVTTGTVPVRRDLLAVKPTDNAYASIFYNSALYSNTWIDPSPVDTNNIFNQMVDAVLSNSMTVDNAVKDASSKLSLLLVK